MVYSVTELFDAKRQINPAHAWTPWLVLVCCLAATAGVTWFVAWTGREQDTTRFRTAVQDAELTIRNRLELYLALLRGGSGLFAATDDVPPAAFRAYVERLGIGANYPGIQGFGFTRQVFPEERAQVVSAMRATGLTNFAIWPETKETETHTILYLEPMDARNRAAIGYNMFSEPTRRAAMERARDTGLPAASGKVQLVQEIDERKQAGFLIYVPVYREKREPATLEERRATLLGYVYAPFRGDDLFAGIFGKSAPRLQLEVYDTGRPTEESLIHRSSDDLSRRRGRGVELPIEVAGRRWLLKLYGTPELESAGMLALVPLTAAAGLLVTLGLFGAALSQHRARRAAEQSALKLQQSQEALRESDELHRIIGETAADAIITIDEQNRIVTANRAAERIFQYSLPELIGHEFSKLMPEPFREPHRQAISRCSEDGGLAVQSVEVPGLRKDGGIVPLEISFGVTRRAGKYLFIGVLRDITERKRAEALQARRAQHAALRADVSLALTRGGGTLRELLQECTDAAVRYVPAAFARIWMLEAEEKVLVLQASSGLYTHLDGPHSRVRVGDLKIGHIAAARKPDFTDDLANDARVADPAWVRKQKLVSFAGYPLLVEDRVLGVMALFGYERFTEDTLDALAGVAEIIAQGLQRREAEKALQQAQRELQRHARELEERVAERTLDLQESVQSLESFSYSIAHDLRAPLRTIHSFADLLLQDHGAQLDDTARNYGRRIVAAAKRMDDLIQDLLAYGRLARHELPNQPMGLQLAVNYVIDQLGSEIESRSASVAVLGPLPRVIANETLLDQVLTNLITNALKFVPPGVPPRIEISAQASNGKVRLLCKDNGIGIEPGQHKRIFGVFERLHAATDYPGTGIGLAIVHKAVERMNGRIGVESEPGVGSVFWVELPAA